MATAGFQATKTADSITAQFWIEIEGIRRRYGILAPSWAPGADTGINQIIREYMTELPSMTGQVAEPLNGTTQPHKFSVKILDVEDELTALFSIHDSSGGVTELAVNAGAVGNITVVDATVFTFPCHIYLNRETMYASGRAGNVITIANRGLYGSKAEAHLVTDDQGNPITPQVTDRPTFMHTREVILCESRVGLVEADAVKYRGYLDDYEPQDGTWVLECSGYLKHINVMIGESLARTTLGRALWNEVPVGDPGSSDPPSYYDPDHWLPEDEPATQWNMLVSSAGQFQASGHVVVGEEIIEYKSITNNVDGPLDALNLNSDTTFAIWGAANAAAARGLFAGEILGAAGYVRRYDPWLDLFYDLSVWCVAHPSGAEVREIIHSQRIKDELSIADGDPLLASHVILAFLTSITGDTSNGTYDILPEGWGAAIDQARVDSAGILNVCKHGHISSVDFSPFAITEPTDIKEWLEENILRPCHLFFIETDEGKISIARLYSKNEAVELTTPTVLTEDNLVEIPTFSPGKPPIGEFKININWHPAREEFLGVVNVILSESRVRYQSTARNFEIDCKTVYDGGVSRGRRSWTSGAMGDLPQILATYLSVIHSSFSALPCPIIKFPIFYNQFIDNQVGQVIALTSTQTPDLKNSDRGIKNAFFQIVEATPNPQKSRLDITAWMIGVHDHDSRLLAPAAKVKDWDGPSKKITLEPVIFSDGIMYTYDVDAFIVTDEIMLVDAAYDGLGGGAPEHREIDAVNSGAGPNDCWVTITVVPANVPAPGDYMVTAAYDFCTVTQKAKWAFLADANKLLGAADDDPHVFER